jgi:protein required for attachment to host cells
MQLPKDATIAVADGETFRLFRNAGDGDSPKLDAIDVSNLNTGSRGSGGRHQSSAANPDQSQLDEDGFAAGIAEHLNDLAVKGKLAGLVVIAAPRTLGELRKHYHQKLSAVLLKEIAKDLTGHPVADIEKSIASA